MARNILSRTGLKQIKRARVRQDGQRVITDDVKKLKSLAIEDDAALLDRENFYREPIEIEYYIPKESRFQVDVKFMYVRLVDPEPRNENQQLIFDYFKKTGHIYDVVEVMNTFPQFLMPIIESYHNRMTMLENYSRAIKAGRKGEIEEYKRALYIMETLRHYEPTMTSLEILGDFTTKAINDLVRVLNDHDFEFSIEDETIAYMIKLHKQYYESKGVPLSERFEILCELFYQQAFPNRGAIDIEDLIS